MIRGTTPTHIFNLPFDVEKISEVRVIYAQRDKPILIKTEKDCTLQDQTIKVNLTQEDTFKFDHRKEVQIQVRVLTTTGDVLTSYIQSVDAYKCLKDEVLE